MRYPFVSFIYGIQSRKRTELYGWAEIMGLTQVQLNERFFRLLVCLILDIAQHTTKLEQFRLELYQNFEKRADAVMNVIDAITVHRMKINS